MNNVMLLITALTHIMGSNANCGILVKIGFTLDALLSALCIGNVSVVTN